MKDAFKIVTRLVLKVSIKRMQILFKLQRNNTYLSIVILNVNNYGKINNIKNVLLLPAGWSVGSGCRYFVVKLPWQCSGNSRCN